MRQNRLSVSLSDPNISTHTNSVSLGRQMPSTASGRCEASECTPDLGLDLLPNDLTRMLYLASLRDCNSGRYLHPELSSQMGLEVADRKLFALHDRVFRRLLATPVSSYVDQLDEYILYTRMERAIVLKTWQTLQAYRATVPMLASLLYCELFCLNIEAALTILNSRSAKKHIQRQEAASH